MNKDQVEGKVKDVAGRIQRQAGEWADSPENQVKGAAKQAEGKLQNAWGNAKDASKKASDAAASKPPRTVPADREDDEGEDRDRRG